MKELTCRCGKNKKRFKFDVGEFYIEECCTQAGFDHLGNPSLAEGEPATLSEDEQAQVDSVLSAPSSKKPTTADKVKSLIGLKPGRGKLRDMTKENLLKMAVEKGIQVKPEATKVEVIALLLS